MSKKLKSLNYPFVSPEKYLHMAEEDCQKNSVKFNPEDYVELISHDPEAEYHIYYCDKGYFWKAKVIFRHERYSSFFYQDADECKSDCVIWIRDSLNCN